MRNAPGRHPEDLSPYLDKDLADKRYEQIRLHLETCAECGEEVLNWQAWHEIFRSPGMEIEVPSLQWREIRARLEEDRSGPSLWERFVASTMPHRLLWRAAAALVVAAGLVFSGLEYRNHSEQKRQLMALSAYSASQQQWLVRADNPFRSQEASMENPFTKFERPNGNPIRK